MPRRNRNAGTPRPDTDQLAAELAQLAAELCPAARYLSRYLARYGQARYLLAVTGGKQPAPQLIPESR